MILACSPHPVLELHAPGKTATESHFFLVQGCLFACFYLLAQLPPPIRGPQLYIYLSPGRLSPSGAWEVPIRPSVRRQLPVCQVTDRTLLFSPYVPQISKFKDLSGWGLAFWCVTLTFVVGRFYTSALPRITGISPLKEFSF